MRKRTIANLCDNIMWYIIYLLPLICYIILLIDNSEVSLYNLMVDTFGIGSTNFIYGALKAIFETGGVFPLFDQKGILLYLTYFICVFLVHLAVDVLLFIPRFAHSLMDSFGGKIE